ncbi:hypothetical protein TASIC1_0009000100 [Trichoderma asperellum]|uniref:Uncharacterized protein n=1 Tax=Trichoderma asperellum TaxID=101201 RepID=A0A6V8QY70_TRIAP|nr:hypothetical protein TASIC1_0009000100 [Trichoderma asperellum]
MEDLSLSALQSHGFIRVTGGIDMTFTVGGIGDVDVSESGLGNPAMTEGSRNDVGGATVPVGGTGMYLQTRVVTDFGKFTVNYPSDLSTSTVNEFETDRSKNIFSIPGPNVMYSSSEKGGLIEIGTYLTFGVEISYNLTWSTSTYFTIQPSSGQTCVNYEIGSAAFASQSDDNKVGWTSSYNLMNLVDDLVGRFPLPSCPPSIFSCLQAEDAAAAHMMNRSNDKVTLRQQEPTNNKICYSTAPNQKRSYLRNETGLVSRASYGGFLGIEGIGQVLKATEILPGLFSDDQLFTKRATVDVSEDEEVEAAVAGDGQVDSDSETTTLISGGKYVTYCTNTYTTIPAYYYPAFPKNASWDWDNIQGGWWDSIAKYYGNGSADCTDWNILRKVTADTITPPGGKPIRCDYQTEHVFEGQLIGIFFTEWLVKGQVPNQAPSVTTRSLTTRTCDWVSDYVEGYGPLSVYWSYPNGEHGPFSEVLLAQLGKQAHLDRLTILQARPNRMKGSLFPGNRVIDPVNEYRFMTPEEQLLAVRDFGMVFSYMNNADVFEAFCSTYNAIYALLISFDQWYQNHAIHYGAPAGISTLSMLRPGSP